ncbi:hypothetical protein CEK62_09350 [Alcanivorax sp. N3-2A]|nr:hypothetical protein CEK62_09350 [Alcanivorax sp. N3-2A]
MGKAWLDWLQIEDQEHCEWAARYLGQRGYIVPPSNDWKPFKTRLNGLLANWPQRDHANQAPQDPAYSPYLMLELRMRSAYYQWKKRREDKQFSTYNLRMRKDLRTLLRQLAKRQKMTIGEALEDLVRRENSLSRDFTGEMDRRLAEASQKAEHKEELHKQRLEQHQRVIAQLTNRAANLEIQLEGVTMPDQTNPEECEAFEDLVEEKASKIREEYQDELSRIVRARRRPQANLPRTPPSTSG